MAAKKLVVVNATFVLPCTNKKYRGVTTVQWGNSGSTLSMVVDAALDFIRSDIGRDYSVTTEALIDLVATRVDVAVFDDQLPADTSS